MLSVMSGDWYLSMYQEEESCQTVGKPSRESSYNKGAVREDKANAEKLNCARFRGLAANMCKSLYWGGEESAPQNNRLLI